MGSPYVTTGTAAKALGVSSVTLLAWAHAGSVKPAFRSPGGHFRWDLDDLRDQLSVSRPGSPDAPEHQPVVAAIVTSDLGVLVARRNPDNPRNAGAPAWTFPAGEIEPDESPADAAVREVKEETGLLVRPGRIIGRRVHPVTARTMIYMTAEPTHGTAVFVGDSVELAEVRWCRLAEAVELLPGIFDPVRRYLGRVLPA